MYDSVIKAQKQNLQLELNYMKSKVQQLELELKALKSLEQQKTRRILAPDLGVLSKNCNQEDK